MEQPQRVRVEIVSSSSVEFFVDDTLEVVRQHIGVAVNMHPNRLFVEAETSFPADYYADTRHWNELFFRVSLDKKTVDPVMFKEYLTHKRSDALAIELAAGFTHDDWLSRPSILAPLFEQDADFLEWQLFGIPETKQIVLPLPPSDEFASKVKDVRIPIANNQSLFETVHSNVMRFRVQPIGKDMGQSVLKVYFPRFTSETPDRLDAATIVSLTSTNKTLISLMKLNVPEPTHISILRGKWYVPLVDMPFATPQNRFEQIFYGLTVSKKTPYIGFFTSKKESMRHKFYVEDPKDKKPVLDIGNWKLWLNSTMPNRKTPTLLLYRGTDRSSFDRIAITANDITLSVYRSKATKTTLEEHRKELEKWFLSLDAVVPFLQTSCTRCPDKKKCGICKNGHVLPDLVDSRWELQDVSLLAKFRKEISEFDMHRFDCLSTLFSYPVDNSFQLLRSEHGSGELTPLEQRAYRALQASDERSAQVLVDQLNITTEEANTIIKKFIELETPPPEGKGKDINSMLRDYPTFKFSTTEVLINSITNIERSIAYADVLRHVLTQDTDTADPEFNQVCKRRADVVEAAAAAPPPPPLEETLEEDMETMMALMTQMEETGIVAPTEEAVPSNAAAETPAAPAPKKRAVKQKEGSIYGYFYNKLRPFDPETFDENYPKKCDGRSQVVIATPEDEERIPDDYKPRKSSKVMEFKGAIAYCPQYWCMRDEIPLTAQQVRDAGDMCPVCKGTIVEKHKIKEGNTVIRRDQDDLFPNYIGKMPCCYKSDRTVAAVITGPTGTTDETYVLSSQRLPALRMGYVDADIFKSFRIATNYNDIKAAGGRLEAGKSNFFRIGLGRPSQTLPGLLGLTTHIPQPKDSKELVLCSFFRTWKQMGPGDDRIVSGIQAAYENGTMPLIDELEYVTMVLKVRVVMVHTATKSMSCGFWSDTLFPDSRTIVMIDNDILGHVLRDRNERKLSYKVDIQKPPFLEATAKVVMAEHARSCASESPTFDDAATEMQKRGKDYEVILDPFGRVQALFVPKEAVLPIQPIPRSLSAAIRKRTYAEIPDDELPTEDVLKSFLNSTQRFQVQDTLYDTEGVPREFLLKSRFRAPFQPGIQDLEAPPAGEILSTIRAPLNEKDLVSNDPNKEDVNTERDVSYSAEVFDFLMFSMSKDILDGHAELRSAIESGNDLVKQIKKWMKSETHWDHAEAPQAFVTKVRTPCGQYTDESACNTTSMCGWQGDKKCQVSVHMKGRDAMINRLAKTLKENSKIRALVLDDRLSPFFSTVLYLEMPHELITNDVTSL
uniref:Uncharacterized protein n=1 Tax=viral metagenome TaxID=1070528 RepID=A0A6C0J8E3_9ZZZZ